MASDWIRIGYRLERKVEIRIILGHIRRSFFYLKAITLSTLEVPEYISISKSHFLSFEYTLGSAVIANPTLHQVLLGVPGNVSPL
jgi:hypothetical protein